LNADVQNADSSSIQKPDCAWTLDYLDTVPKNGIKVMSTFACGGGSSMGYKRAGCEIVAANDIDPEMAYHYKLNLKPKRYYLCPIRDLITTDLPDELFNLDILDGSPPCSTFSMAGSREKSWGKDKHFREGQQKQVLSDLFFDYLDLVNRLRPKVAIAENVKGMILGNAKGYTKMVMQRFKEIGYRPQLFLVNAADCGVPQRRERVFFCAVRDDIQAKQLTLKPQNRWISVGEAIKDFEKLTENEIQDTQGTATDVRFWKWTTPGESYSAVCMKMRGKASFFGHLKIDPQMPSSTLTTGSHLLMHWAKLRSFSFREWKRLGSFPDDYQAKTDKIGKYMIGMSVPPKMTEVVAKAVIDQWLTPPLKPVKV
jgi:DNA (cytosine-5)-methyltransferase 1